MKMKRSNLMMGLGIAASVAVLAAAAWAQTTPAAPAAPAAAAPAAAAAAAAPKLDSGDTAWMLTSTALVLMMTVPGLALFYGGMVRKMNVLATVMQSFAVTCLVTVLWTIVGYSLAFTPGTPVVGGLSRFMLNGMAVDAVNDLAKTIPESVYMTFQMTFAIITPALICGAFADRMKFSAMMWFMTLWSLIVYSPIAHSVWGPDGFLSAAGVLDFAGGTVVHINAGVAGLVCALVLGKRRGDDGEGHLEGHVDRFRNRRRQRVDVAELHVLQEELADAAEIGAALGEGEAVADDRPQHRHQAGDREALHHRRQHVHLADHAAIEQRQARDGHHQDQRRRGQHPGGVAGIELGCGGRRGIRRGRSRRRRRLGERMSGRP